MYPFVRSLSERVLTGDRRSVARAITLAENGGNEAESLMRRLYHNTGRAHVIGVTGSPGSGKSTLVDKLISAYSKNGKRVGVIAVDPSSPFSGGAILADRIRMQQHAEDPKVFIRSMGSRGALGGVSTGTKDAAMILDASGCDVILIETVGVGQSEIDIIRIADTVCLVLVPGMGDDIQAMKAGIMEIADVFAVNKSDLSGAGKVVAEIRMALDLARSRDWVPPIVSTIAETGVGMVELSEAFANHATFLKESDTGKKKRREKIVYDVESILLKKVSGFIEKSWAQTRTDALLRSLENREIDPYEVSENVFRTYFPTLGRGNER